MERLDLFEGGLTGLRLGQADEVELEGETALPEGFAGVEQREVVFASLDAADGQDDGQVALGGSVLFYVTCIQAERDGLDGRVGGEA